MRSTAMCRRPRGERAQAGRRARASARGDRTLGEEARQPGVRREGAAPGRRGRAGQARPASGRARSVMTPDEAERYLLSLELFGMRFGLDRMRRLMTALGEPERAFESI